MLEKSNFNDFQFFLLININYDNVNLPHLRFYCRRVGLGEDVIYEPLIVPDRQMESLKIICDQQDADTIVVPNDKHQFEKGETVIVTGGNFMDVI